MHNPQLKAAPKKIKGVCTTTYKINNKHFQLLVYEDDNEKLYSDTIFSSVSRGEVIRKADLDFLKSKFNLKDDEVLHFILNNSTKQTHCKLRGKKVDILVYQLTHILQKKVLKNGRFFTLEELTPIVKQYLNPNVMNEGIKSIGKHIVSRIIKEEEDIKEVDMRIHIIGKVDKSIEGNIKILNDNEYILYINSKEYGGIKNKFEGEELEFWIEGGNESSDKEIIC